MDSPSLTPPANSELGRELQALWQEATPETIGPALEAARAKVAAAPEAVRKEVEELMMSLEQLERWLHDR